MAETTKIEWADATLSLWWGCTEVSPACANCYARTLAKRFGQPWGKGAPRGRKKGAAALARKLNRKAEREGRRLRVFAESMGDWLDPEVSAEWLADLLGLVAETPNLDWLLLSKRPHLWRERVRAAAAGPGHYKATALARDWAYGEVAPPNVWVGCTVEDQEHADRRIPALLEIPARVRFLSMEPLLGPVDLGRWIGDFDCHHCGARFWGDWPGNHWNLRAVNFEDDPEGGEEAPGDPAQRYVCPDCRGADYGTGDVGHNPDPDPDEPGLHWVIAGGESGRGARASHPDWFRSLRDQATSAGVAFHFKQHGEWLPIEHTGESRPTVGPPTCWVRPDGGVSTGMAGWPGWALMRRVGKAAAGRLLDGRTWDELPEARP